MQRDNWLGFKRVWLWFGARAYRQGLGTGFRLGFQAETSTDQDWISTEANFGRIRTGSDCIFFLIGRSGLDWTENIFVILM